MAKLGPGARIGDQFNLIRKIGEGGCGEVYLAEQTTLGRHAVVKLMHPELSRDPSYVARFRREAKLAASLTHHHTAAIYAFGETPGRVLWIAMEYIEGESLHNVLARDPPERLAELLEPVADVLDRAGALGIIHRDVKPDNIIVSPDGPGRRAVLLDFGLARPMEDNDKLTELGVAVGSPTYMSPEQVFGPAVDSAADRYALGIILYIAVAKRPPFRHDDRVQLVLMHKRQPVPQINTILGSIPRGHPLDRFFTRALAKQPKDRYPSARQMISEFLEALDPTQFTVQVPGLAPAAAQPAARAPGAQGESSLGARSTLFGLSQERSAPIWGEGVSPARFARDDAAQARAGGATEAARGREIGTVPAPRRVSPPPLPAEIRQKIATGASRMSPQGQRTGMPATGMGPTRDEVKDPVKDEVPASQSQTRLFAWTGPSGGLDILCATEALLGKHRDCELVCRAFPTPEQDAITHGVSRQHARLWAVNGKLLIADLNSLNGTYVDDKRLPGGPAPLYDEARIRLGPVLTIEVRLFRSGAALLRRVDAYGDDSPPTLLLWDRVALAEPVLGLVPATGDHSATFWGTLQNPRQGDPRNQLFWDGPGAVEWQRGNGKVATRPQALQPGDRLVLGPLILRWESGVKPGLGHTFPHERRQLLSSAGVSGGTS